MNKEELIDNIYTVLSRSICMANSYNRRSRGFVSELMFKNSCKKNNLEYLDGGWIFFMGGSLDVEKKANYITVSTDTKSRYNNFYSRLDKSPMIKSMFFAEIECEDEWRNKRLYVPGNTVIEIPEPRYRVYEFIDGEFIDSDIGLFLDLYQMKKGPVSGRSRFYNQTNKSKSMLNYLADFEKNDLLEVYANRYIIDILMKDRVYNAPMDFDGILKNKEDYTVIETKEKDPGPSNRGADRTEWYFGWDAIRLLWYLYLVSTTELDCWNVILEINNQTERRPLGWKKISVEKFCRVMNWNSALQGGVGMGPTAGSTVVAPYNAFGDFQEISL